MTSDNEEDSPAEPGSAESDSDEDERPNRKLSYSLYNALSTCSVTRLSSSIHTIHRPLARSQRINIPIPSKLSHKQTASEEDTLEDVASPLDEDELETDFEESPRPATTILQQQSRTPESIQTAQTSDPFNAMRERTGSMATVRLHRRARLAEKLKEVYDLDDIREVWAGACHTVLVARIISTVVFLRNALLASTLSL